MAANFTAFSFLTCSLAFAGLALMLRPARFGRGVPRARLRVAALGTSIWAIATLWAASSGRLTGATAQLSSLAVMTLWLWQLQSIARWQEQPTWFTYALRWTGVGVIGSILLLTAVARGNADLTAVLARVLPIGGLVLASLGLFALEQIYRHAPASAIAAIRWLALGVGGIFVAQLAVFAQSLLLGAVPVEPWLITGFVLALCALAIARGAWQMPDWSFGLSISRHVVFYTTSFVAIGGYLVALGLSGWLLLSTTETWGWIARISFVALAALTLVLLLFSGAFLRRLRAFISKHFYPHRYDYRLEWLRFIKTLSEQDGHATVPQRCIRAVAQIIESPGGTLWRRDAESNAFRCGDGWGKGCEVRSSDIATDDVLPEYLRRTGWLIDGVELADRPQLYDHLALDFASYGAPPNALIVPLLHIDQLYGWLILERPKGLAELTFEDRDLLKTAGRQIAAYLSQYDSDLRLAEARQFETYNRMTAFIMHDLKNIAAQLRLVSQNAERHKRNPEFVDDAMSTIAASSARMTKLISQLTSTDAGANRPADLVQVAERAASHCASSEPAPHVSVLQRVTVCADLDRLIAIVEHAIRNAQDATPATGEVRVEVDRAGAHPVIRIIDTGTGMDESFVRERLFKPFDTTKGAKGMGIGAFQIREYLRSLGGAVQVDSAPGAGTKFTLVFPAEAAEPARMTG